MPRFSMPRLFPVPNLVPTPDRIAGVLRHVLTSVLVACGLLAASAGAQVRAADGARVVLVLDASGSMWSRVGDRTKIDIARETVGTILAGWRPEDQLGLVVYGHRRRGDCGDIEVMKPIGPVDHGALMQLVGSISPKGRTPMTEAVRVAAEQLKSAEGTASVILVSDGIETCDADPCAVAASLKQADVHLVVHTVGFDIQDPEASRQLACMARATGGLSLSASNAKDLAKAIQQAVYVAQKDAPSEPPPPPPPPPAPPPEPVLEWNLVGSARLAEGDDPLAGKDSIAWQFFKPAPDGAFPEPVATSYSTRIEAKLEPGPYTVTIEAGAAKATAQVVIEPGRFNHLDVVLNAGRLGLRAKRTETVNEQGSVHWQVLSKDGSAVFNAYEPETSTIIPAGEYTVSLALGEAKLTRDVEIAPGETTAVEIVAAVGRMEGAVIFAPGGPAVKSPAVAVLKGAEPVDNESPLDTVYDDTPKFDLPAGAYRVKVTVDSVTRSFPFEVRPGETTRVPLSIDAGLVAFDAPWSGSIAISGTEQDIYGDAASLATLYPDYKPYVLMPGHYKAVAEKDGVKAEAEFDITPGKRTVARIAAP